MATFKRIELGSGSINYIKLATKKKGDLLVESATYLGISKVPNFNNTGMVDLHKFKDQEEKVHGINGTSILNRRLEGIQPGSILDLEFLGEADWAEKRKGMRLPYDFKVYSYVSEDQEDEEV